MRVHVAPSKDDVQLFHTKTIVEEPALDATLHFHGDFPIWRREIATPRPGDSKRSDGRAQTIDDPVDRRGWLLHIL